MDNSDIQIYKQFRLLCIQNAADALKAAELLAGKGVNHIVFHLSLLAVEELGKIFILWHNLNAEGDWNKDKFEIPLDDHVKKLFWAIWGPSFGEEKITRQSIDETRGMAKRLHNRRLDSLYTDVVDIASSASKVSDSEASMILGFVKARLHLSNMEGDIDEYSTPSDLLLWFNQMTNSPQHRSFIFGDVSQEKLVELGNAEEWFAWLKERFDEEEKLLKEITSMELNRKGSKNMKELVPKWKIKFKIISQSHSIRPNVLNSFNKRFDFIQLFRGPDNHTLFVEATFDKSVVVTELWRHGWMVGKLFVAALNVGSHGLFYWNTLVDLEKYYEEIRDVENDKKISLTLATKLALGLHTRKMALTEEQLYLSQIVFEYFMIPTKKTDIYFIDNYMTGLALFAKTDIHLRFEGEIFYRFYNCYKSAVLDYQKCGEGEVKDIGYQQIERLLKGNTEYGRIMDLAAAVEKSHQANTLPITLQEVVLMKQYCGACLLTLAVVNLKNDPSFWFTLSGEPEAGS